MITSLTPEQEAMLAQVRDEWIGHGLSTEPADRPAAEAGVRLAYERAGLTPPSAMVWLDSPMAGAIATAQVWDQVRDQVRTQVRTQVGAQVWAQVRDQVQAQVWAQVWDQVRAQVQAQVWAQVRDQVQAQVFAQVRAQVQAQVWAQVWDQVQAQVGAQVGDQVRDQVSGQVDGKVRAQVGSSLWGQHDAGWLSWADAMTRIGVDCDARGLSQVARSAGWWWAGRDIAILTDRPDTLHRDAQGRLHCPTGPALRYRDGWSIYAWHGTRVPADLIETGWDIQRTLTEPNAEVRRCAVEITAGRDGWDRIIREAGWRQVGQDEPDPGNPGQILRLYHVPYSGAERGGVGLYDDPVRLLHCVNATRERDGSRHEFGLTVPADIADPVAAAAWTFGVTPDAYRSLQRAC